MVQNLASTPHRQLYLMAILCLSLASDFVIGQALIAQQGQARLAQGKRVALFQVHFEGNVGDQMEVK